MAGSVALGTEVDRRVNLVAERVSIGTAMRVARVVARLSLAEAAVRLSVAPNTLSNYENDRREPPPEIVVKAAEVYNNQGLLHVWLEHCPVYRALAESEAAS
nr:MAG: hypothetical protein DIU58_17640 [Sphaerobacter thermophilus]